MPSLNDWRPFGYEVPDTSLDIRIHDDHVLVESNFKVLRYEDTSERAIFLDGETAGDDGFGLDLQDVAVNGVSLANNEYGCDQHGLTIHDIPDECELRIRQKLKISPHAVDGLYFTGESLVTQCEDEAFRKIAYYPDRPDVLSKWTVRVEADKDQYPVLLSNGDSSEIEEVGSSRHATTYIDPFAKPCYLFALAAGKFASLHSTFRTRENKMVDLTIYSDEKSIRDCSWAMNCLKRAMSWDEDVYDRVYDLERFGIVAVERFVFGAMENKSLNVFNNLVLLASPDIATDDTYARIERVVGHEYFHNYSGNRVTVRDWFQLSLKEGFTVLRDQSFARDQNGFDINRILDAELMREEQFPEAQSGLGHPIQPIEMEVPANYYTRTIYEGGAEVGYMLSGSLGDAEWQNATNHYFEKYDGQAVTLNDFVCAIGESADRDLTQFKRWYSTAGTPIVEINERRENGHVYLDFVQSIFTLAESQSQGPLEIPIKIGLVDPSTNDRLQLEFVDNEDKRLEYQTKVQDEGSDNQDAILNFTTERAEVRLDDVPADARISVLRDFSAPVEVRYTCANDESADLARIRDLALHDTNAFGRYDAIQQIMIGSILHPETYLEVLTEIVDTRSNEMLNSSLDAQQQRINAIQLRPSYEGRILDLHRGTSVDEILEGKAHVQKHLGSEFAPRWQEIASKYTLNESYEHSENQATARQVRALALRYDLASREKDDQRAFAEDMVANFRNADNLTDRMTFFRLLLRVNGSDDLHEEISDEFYQRFKDESLVVEKWLSAYIGGPALTAREKIAKIEAMGLLESATPNRWRAVFGSFVENWENFHLADGSGYDFYTERLIQDASEHGSVVRRGIQPFAYLHRYDASRCEHMRRCLERLQTELPESNIPALDMVARSLKPSKTAQ